MGGSDNSSAASNMNTSEKKLNHNLNDVGWEYGELVNPNVLDKLKCKLWSNKCSAGVYIIKQHIAGIRGNIRACLVLKKMIRRNVRPPEMKEKIRKGKSRNNKPKLEMRSN